jgi:membrane associated rhomboid family serine protease
MFLPYNVDVPMERLPVANWLLIAVTTVVTLLSQAAWWSEWYGLVKGDPRQVTPEKVRALQAPPDGALRSDHFHYSQLVTHLFVHAGLLHLAVNMVFLFCFGNAVDAKLGHLAFLSLYLALGVFAGAAWMLVGPSLTLPALVGASGAVNGVVGLFVVLFPRNQVRVLYSWGLRRGGGFEMPALAVVGIFFACDVLGALFDSDGGVGYLAHVAGLLGGVAVGLVLVATGLVKPTAYEENLLQVLGLQGKEERRKEKRR